MMLDSILPGLSREVVGGYGGRRPWVAEILGADPQYGLLRRFLQGKSDYLRSNATGSRGIFVYFVVEEGRIYEASYYATWSKRERYFFRFLEGGKQQRMTRDEVRMEMLND